MKLQYVLFESSACAFWLVDFELKGAPRSLQTRSGQNNERAIICSEATNAVLKACETSVNQLGASSRPEMLRGTGFVRDETAVAPSESCQVKELLCRSQTAARATATAIATAADSRRKSLSTQQYYKASLVWCQACKLS